MDIAEQPVPEHRAHTGLCFLFEQIEQRRHSVAHRFPAWRHVARGAQIHRVVPVAGQCAGRNQASRDAGLEQFAVPVLVGRADQSARIGAADDVRDRPLHDLERLPVATRRQRVAVLAIIIMMIRIPVSLPSPARSAPE